MKLTATERRAVCIHEAGHAVVHSLGGACVYRLAVAPVGSTAWTFESRKGGTLLDLWGACSLSDPPLVAFFMKWNEWDCSYDADRKQFNEALGQDASALRRIVRSHVCGLVAGPMAEAIFLGEEPYVWESLERHEDVAKAMGMARLLPWRREYEHLVDETEKVLRLADIWKAVERLASALEERADMCDFSGFLPRGLAHWPPSPMARRIPEFGRLTFLE